LIKTEVSVHLQCWRFIWCDKYNSRVLLQETPFNTVCAGHWRHSRHANTWIMDFPEISYTQVGRSWPSGKHRGGGCA